jgi:hypothetical protein
MHFETKNYPLFALKTKQHVLHLSFHDFLKYEIGILLLDPHTLEKHDKKKNISETYW